MTIKVGICGTGAFADGFIPLFKAHPLVSDVILCDLDRQKLTEKSRKFKITKTCSSLDELCQSDVDAIGIFTQNWKHGPQAVQALKSGKDVYSAVPCAHTLEEVKELVQTVEHTDRLYMVGETSYYSPEAIYCRQRFKNGDFGRIVYAEGEYFHDFDHGLYDVCKWRGGKDWKRTAGVPPMYYPTHSIAMIVSVTGAHMTQVSCLGFEDNHEDGLFRKGVNQWDNTFSNETALFRMSDGSICRINEFRRIGFTGQGERLGCINGTDATFELNELSSVWITKKAEETTDLTSLFKASRLIPAQVGDQMSKLDKSDSAWVGASSIHPVGRLPKEFKDLPNGHRGSHQFLVDDFVKACTDRTIPPNNVWQAARYLVPGLIAHESAVRNGQMLNVPDFGDAPTGSK
jgi:predicted dehydrogenase